MWLFYIIGAIYLGMVARKHPDLCRLSFRPILTFLKYMVFITSLRMLMFILMQSQPHSAAMDSLSLCSVLGVFWEDAVFCLPLLVMDKLKVSRYLKYISIALSSLIFATGHLAYSPMWATITLLYIPCISYRFGKKHGILTVMVCHILFDLITLITYRLFL